MDRDTQTFPANRREPPVQWPGEGVSRIPFEVYASAEQYRLEGQHLWKGPVWSFLGLEGTIPESGDYFVSRLGETEIIVVRGEDETVRGFVNRCSHRARYCALPLAGTSSDSPASTTRGATISAALFPPLHLNAAFAARGACRMISTGPVTGCGL